MRTQKNGLNWIYCTLVLLATLGLSCCKSVPPPVQCQYPPRPEAVLPGLGQMTKDLEAILVNPLTSAPKLMPSNSSTKVISQPADVF